MKSRGRVYRGRCSWRKRQIRRAAHCGRTRLRYAMVAMLAVEAAVLVPYSLRAQGIRFQVLRQEQSCQVEWVIPGEGLQASAGEIYGLRLVPGTWEIQIYHRQEILRPEG